MASSSPSPPPAIVTGASGFVGRALMAQSPRARPLPLSGERWSDNIAAERGWRGATVLHLAARVHRPGDADTLFARDNVDKTIELARAAAKGGAARFVFLSSIKVNGEETSPGRRFHPLDPAAPQDAYARSKWDAEQALADIGKRAGMPIVVVRSPLVVGAGAGGNLRALMGLARRPWPLPFAAIDNRRTLVCVEDLARLLIACALSTSAPGKVIFAGDPRPVSTPWIVSCLRRAWQQPARLFAMRPRTLEALGGLAGARARVRRLTRSLEVDVSGTLRDIGWAPEIALEQGLARMARAFADRKP